MRQTAPLLLALMALGCTGAGGAQHRAAAARGTLNAGLQQPYYTEADVSALSEQLMNDPHLAPQLGSDEERDRVLTCVFEEASVMVPTVAAALELGEERLKAVNEAIGRGCMEAHRTEVLLSETWSGSFPAVYASTCAANAPEVTEMCECIGTQAPQHFESPAAFNLFEQALESAEGPDADQQARFEDLLEACGEVSGEGP